MQIIVQKKDEGARLDVFLARELGRSRTNIQELIRAGAVFVNGKIKTPHEKVAVGSTIEVKLEHEETASCELLPEPEMPLKILAEEKDFLVVYKPVGILTHPIPKHCRGTLVGAALAHAPEVARVGDSPLRPVEQLRDSTGLRPGIVHRLDRDASGLLVIAKTQEMFEHLKRQFAGRKIKKEYLALVYGIPSKSEGVITFTLEKTKKGIMATRPKGVKRGKEAETSYKILNRFDKRFALLKIAIVTGRTHQIRAHLKAIGHPIVGDSLYKIKRIKEAKVPRLMLHAATLGFKDLTGVWREFNCPPPEEFVRFLAELK